MSEIKLFMLLLGGKPAGRHTEQHDIFFGIGETVGSLIPAIKAFWPEIKGKVHIDAYREVSEVDGYAVSIAEKGDNEDAVNTSTALFFLNLGGYKQGAFDEFHYRMVIAADSMDKAKKQALNHGFFKHHDLEDSATNHMARAHIDDKYGIDVDDAYAVADILNEEMKKKYTIILKPSVAGKIDELHLGYMRLVDMK